MVVNKDIALKICAVLALAVALFVVFDLVYESEEEAAAASARRRLERRIGKLASEDWEVSVKAAIDIANLGPAGEPAVDALIAQLSRDVEGEGKKERNLVRRHAVYALGKIGPAADDAIEPIQEVLEDDDPVTRIWAVQALVRIDPETEPRVDILIEALGYKDISVRSNAIGGIELVGARGVAAVPGLIEQLADPELRRHAARALGRIGPGAREAIGPLAKLLRQEESIRDRRRDDAAIDAIKEALEKIGG